MPGIAAGLRPLLGGVCVYDTGSTDRTVALAKACGAKVVEGYWDGDFARARNESLAMTDAVWALIIDADERVSADVDALRRILGSADGIDVLDANFTHVDDSGRPIGRSSYSKIVRVADIRYVGHIHETPLRRDGAETRTGALTDDQLMFTHFGYATPSIRRAKAERNALAAAVDVEAAAATEDRGRLAEALYHHARSVLRLGDPESQAAPELERAWQLFTPGSLGRERAVAMLVPELLRRGREQVAAAWVRKHLQSGGSSVHARLLAARIALRRGRPEDALVALASVPDEGEPSSEVDPRTVLDVRIRARD